MTKEPRYPVAGWHALASACAKDAHENYFHSRRGTWRFEDLGVGVVVLYDNNPTVDPSIRLQLLRDLEEKLKAEDIKRLATASYPVSGEADGYTVAMVFVGPHDPEEKLRAFLHELLMVQCRKQNTAQSSKTEVTNSDDSFGSKGTTQ